MRALFLYYLLSFSNARCVIRREIHQNSPNSQPRTFEIFHTLLRFPTPERRRTSHTPHHILIDLANAEKFSPRAPRNFSRRAVRHIHIHTRFGVHCSISSCLRFHISSNCENGESTQIRASRINKW